MSKDQKAFSVGKNIWSGWLIGHDYCICSTKGNNHQHGCANLHLQQLQPFIILEQPFKASSGKCLYTSPMLSTADLFEKTQSREAVQGSGSLDDGSHTGISRWWMDVCVSVCAVSFKWYIWFVSHVSILIYIVSAVQSAKQRTHWHMWCAMDIFSWWECTTVNLSCTNARFVFRVGKINIPIHKC